MTLSAGARLGPYEILATLGAGGQGEVYRARDGRLDRDVAIKILPEHLSEDPGALARFEREAKAVAALSHPNILAIHDFGRAGRTAYAVMELLEGETLRMKLQEGSIPARKAIDYASQIARGLGAAHDRGVAHRDLKPENLFVTKEGRVKILDFGLARQETAVFGSGDESHSPTEARLTEPGLPLGTVGYMSPEQVRGRSADARADIFAFGCVLYEMLAGRKAFQRETAAETMTAILKEDPPPLSETTPHVAPALERILGRCLEKHPDERFRSANDLAFALEAVSGSAAGAGESASRTAGSRKRLLYGVAAGAALIASFLAGRLEQTPAASQLTYRQLTFERGTLLSARFAPDGDTIVYSAAWGGNPAEIFSTRDDFQESRKLGISNATLLSVSAAGEMAIAVRAEPTHHYEMEGTLARAPIEGGAPREVLESVREADWSPDGSQLAVVRYQGGLHRLEFPPGKPLYQTAGYISYPRFSPRGDLIAFLDHPVGVDNRGSVRILDLSGRLTVVSQEWEAEEGLAWSKDGSEIWFTAQKAGEPAALRAVTIRGKERVILRAPGNGRILDVDAAGRTLLSIEEYREEAMGLAPGDDRPRDLSYLGMSWPSALSRDGRTVLLTHCCTSTNYDAYLRSTDGSPPVRLGTGAGLALSLDGKWVATLVYGPPAEIVLLPSGAGESRRIPNHGFIASYSLDFHPDGRRVTFIATAPERQPSVYVQDIGGDAPPRALTPPGYEASILSPDGKWVAARNTDGKWWLIPVDAGEKRLAPGVGNGEIVAGWSANSLALFVYLPEPVTRVYRVDLEDGAREFWKEVAPLDPVGAQMAWLLVAPDVNAYVASYRRLLSELYLVEGLR